MQCWHKIPSEDVNYIEYVKGVNIGDATKNICNDMSKQVNSNSPESSIFWLCGTNFIFPKFDDKIIGGTCIFPIT